MKPEANSTLLLDKDGTMKSLTTLLSNALVKYTTAKSIKPKMEAVVKGVKKGQVKMSDDTLSKLLSDASYQEGSFTRECLSYITYAKNMHLIEETSSITSKLNKIQKENEQLKSENLTLKKMNQILKNQNKQLSKIFPGNKKDNVEFGDVSQS